jgi:hypothetical protein
LEKLIETTYEPSGWAQVVNELQLRTSCLGEAEFESWLKQPLARFYLPLG